MSEKLIVEYGIFGILSLMSIISLGLSLERIWFFMTLKYEKYTSEKVLELDLSRNLSVISIIAYTAPYIGLLGTVIGIMLVFAEIANTGTPSNALVMGGLALTLKATAFGLVVAIPSSVAYNLLVRKSEIIISKWEILNENHKA